ncbi:MAG TPA: ribbon-helix-helix protein, CopG family [Nocardioidaceae bacterium]|nr:ribbon-helix-helix protein, CopG family [Nocardioidaceae bacterium]
MPRLDDRTPYQIRLAPELTASLDRIAERTDLPRSAVIRMLLAQGCATWDGERLFTRADLVRLVENFIRRTRDGASWDGTSGTLVVGDGGVDIALLTEAAGLGTEPGAGAQVAGVGVGVDAGAVADA